MKKSFTIPPVLDLPPATRIIKQLTWLNDDDDDLAEYLLVNCIPLFDVYDRELCNEQRIMKNCSKPAN